MMLSTNVRLVLRLQLTEQQQVKLCECLELTVRQLAAVQTGTALLVKVSVFRYLV
jgi:hypothetical protein